MIMHDHMALHSFPLWRTKCVVTHFGGPAIYNILALDLTPANGRLYMYVHSMHFRVYS